MFVSDKKKETIKKSMISACENCENGCNLCLKKCQFIDLLAEANIPVSYWFLQLKDFKGSEHIKNTTIGYIANMADNFNDGKNLIYMGQYGVGKTYAICSLLKSALIKKYSVYYTSMLDLVHYLSDYTTQKMFYGILVNVDILAIDEVDSRHFSNSDQAQQYFGSSLERIIRYRQQNKLPTLIASNNNDVSEIFTGQYKKVIDSLLSVSTEIVPAIGKDFRKTK